MKKHARLQLPGSQETVIAALDQALNRYHRHNILKRPFNRRFRLCNMVEKTDSTTLAPKQQLVKQTVHNNHPSPVERPHKQI